MAATLAAVLAANGSHWAASAGLLLSAAGLAIAGLHVSKRSVARTLDATLRPAHEALAVVLDEPPDAMPKATGRDASSAAAAWADHLRGCAGRVQQVMASLEAAYGELSTFLQVIDEPVLVCDEHQVVILLNAAAQEMLGLEADTVLGRGIDEVFTNAEILSLHARASRGELCKRRVTIAGENGNRVAAVSAVPVPVAGADDADRSGVLLVLRDVSELARALQVRTDFAANASHELRTPIAAVRGAVDTLAAGAAGDPAARDRFLGMLDENVTRLEDLIRDLLDLSRLEAADGATRISLVPASEIERVLRPAFEADCERTGVSLRFAFDKALERLRTDRNLLTIILRNLIENAIKFSESGQEVVVRGSAVYDDQSDGTLDAIFEVIDHGQGIPLPMQQRIFERFYQADGSRDGAKDARGTGLGLAIVNHAVRSLDGRILVKSIWQQGTTMTVELKAAVNASELGLADSSGDAAPSEDAADGDGGYRGANSTP
ncbi:MAG: ATP-binding protein [Planctomycetota bacterium]